MESLVIGVRAMAAGDLEEVAVIERSVYADPWSKEAFLEELEAPNRTYIVAIEGGMVLGYAGLMTVGEDAHVTTLSVTEARQGEGIGTRLLLELVETATGHGAHHLTLEVRASNQRAQGLYRRFGLGPVGVRRRYYQSEDALVMWAHDINGSQYRRRIERIKEEVG